MRPGRPRRTTNAAAYARWRGSGFSIAREATDRNNPIGPRRLARTCRPFALYLVFRCKYISMGRLGPAKMARMAEPAPTLAAGPAGPPGSVGPAGRAGSVGTVETQYLD